MGGLEMGWGDGLDMGREGGGALVTTSHKIISYHLLDFVFTKFFLDVSGQRHRKCVGKVIHLTKWGEEKLM